jgi:hypothetical protein
MAFMFAVASVANAQATRTWVSGVGDDVNPCSRTAPCKTFAGAISKTAKDGEIDALDPGGFGTITITKSITLNGTHGQGFGSILSALAPGGVTVNITDPADARKTVRLRSLDINGASTGTDGIRVITSTLGGTSVIVEDCVIDGLTGTGINATFGAGGNLVVRDSVIRNCVTAGIKLSSTSGFAVGSIENTGLQRNGIGMDAGTGAFATVTGGNASQSASDGFRASGSNTQLNVTNSVVANAGGAAFNASVSGAKIRISSNQIYNNTTSIAIAAGATVDSDADNRVSGNAGGVAPNGVITKQ